MKKVITSLILILNICPILAQNVSHIKADSATGSISNYQITTTKRTDTRSIQIAIEQGFKNIEQQIKLLEISITNKISAVNNRIEKINQLLINITTEKEPRVTDLPNLLTLFTIIIALSAYLATIRLIMIDRLLKMSDEMKELVRVRDENELTIEEEILDEIRKSKSLPGVSLEAKKLKIEQKIENISKGTKKLSEKLVLLIIPDILLIISAVILGFYIFLPELTSGKSFTFKLLIGLFMLSGTLLVVYHMQAWRISIRKWIESL